MNLTDLERELDAACGGKSLSDTRDDLLRDCHKLLSSLGHGDGMTLTEWHMKRVQLIERIESVVKV